MNSYAKPFCTLLCLAVCAVAQDCSDHYIGFDNNSTLTTPGFSINDTHLAAGSGSLDVQAEGASYTVALNGVQTGTIGWFGFFENSEVDLQVVVSFVTSGGDAVGDFVMFMARDGNFGMSFNGEEQTFVASVIYTWHTWAATFDWEGRAITMHTDYTSRGAFVFPENVVGVEAVTLQQGRGTGGKFDTLQILCPATPLTMEVEPACPTTSTGKIVFNRGELGKRIGTSDLAALVLESHECVSAATECAALNACSATSGNFSIPDSDSATWEYSNLTTGVEKSMKVCFFHAALDEWVQVGTLTLCEETTAPKEISITVTVDPACPTPTEGGKFVFNSGSRVFGSYDWAALVANDEQCASATTACAPLNACSLTSGEFTQPSTSQADWSFAKLTTGDEKVFKVCYYHATSDEWILVDTVTLCDDSVLNATDEDGDDDSSSILLYIIIGAVVCVLLIILVGLFFYRATRKRRNYPHINDKIADSVKGDEGIELAAYTSPYSSPYTSPVLPPSSPPIHPESMTPPSDSQQPPTAQNALSKSRRGSHPTARNAQPSTYEPSTRPSVSRHPLGQNGSL